jgi:hypothetical protein
MTSWTLKHIPSGKEQSLAAWGLSRPRRRLVNQQTSTVTVRRVVAACDAAAQFSYKDAITIYRIVNSIKTPWFQGIVTELPVSGSAANESLDFVISDAWWFLETKAYEQQWVSPSYPGATPFNDPYRCHVFLNKWIYHSVGNYFTRTLTDAQIADVRTYLTTAGAAAGETYPFTFATPPQMDIPIQECEAISCAEVIRKELAFMPDTAVFFDYTQATPQLQFLRHSAQTDVSIPFSAISQTDEWIIKPRYDLLCPSVSLKFEQLNQISVAGNNQQWLLTTPQIYPPAATGKERGALVLTVKLEGMDEKVTQAAINVGAVQTSSGVDPSADPWWLSKQPWLERCDSASINSLTYDTPSGPGLPVDGMGNPYSHELLSGQICPWMGYLATSCVINAEIEYTTHQPAPGDPAEGPYTGLPISKAKRNISVRVQMTNAPTGAQTLYSLATAIAAEQIPSTLAADLYAGVGFLHYEGNFTIQEEECSGQINVGNALNITGSKNSAWGTMRSIVQIIEEDWESGRTTVTFGPPTHLKLPDLVTLFELNRYRQIYNNPAMQTVSAQDTGQTQLGQQTAIENSTGGGDAHSSFGVSGYYSGASLVGGVHDVVIPAAPSGPSDPAQGTGRIRGASIGAAGPSATIPPSSNGAPLGAANAWFRAAAADTIGSDGNYHPTTFREVIVCDKDTCVAYGMIILASDRYTLP